MSTLQDMVAKAKKQAALVEQQKQQAAMMQQEAEEARLQAQAAATSEITPIGSFDLSLDGDEALTQDLVLANLKAPKRQISGSPDIYSKAKRKVARLTTGAAASVPIICKGASCPFSAKCVAESSKILTPKGNTKISNLKSGDTIYSTTPTGVLVKDKVVDVACTGKAVVYTVHTACNAKVVLTKDHRILMKKGNRLVYGTIENGDIVPGVQVMVADPHMERNVTGEMYGDLFEEEVLSVKEEGEVDVYDITVEGYSNFVAGNIVVHNCAYFQAGIHEEGIECLREEQLIEYWSKKLFEDLKIDPNSISEIHTLSRLVEIAILDLRMTEYLSINNPDLMMDFIASTDVEGNPNYQKGISVAFEVKERLEKQRMKLLESLNSTREKRFRVALDTVTASSKLSDRDSLLNHLDKLAKEIRDQRAGVIIDGDCTSND